MFRSLSHSCLVLDGLIPFVIVFLQCRELEVDLDNETRRGSEIQKNAKKMERRLKDVSQQQEEDQKNLQHAKDQIDRLNKKCKTTKANQDEAVSWIIRFNSAGSLFNYKPEKPDLVFSSALPLPTSKLIRVLTKHVARPSK